MTNNIIAASILAIGLSIAAFIQGGRYEFIDVGTKVIAGDHWTGEVDVQPTKTEWDVE